MFCHLFTRCDGASACNPAVTPPVEPTRPHVNTNIIPSLTPDENLKPSSAGDANLHSKEHGIGPDGRSYLHQNQQALPLTVKDESGWEMTIVDGARNAGLFPSLVAEPGGCLHISYLERTGANAGTIKYATKGADDKT